MRRSSLPSSIAADLAYCHEVLPRVSRTFAINIRLLGPALRDPVCVGYLLCRASDALEDSWPGSPEQVRERFDLFRRGLKGDAAAIDALAKGVPLSERPRGDLDLLRSLA